MSSVTKEVDGEVVRVVVKPPQGISVDKLLQYLRGVMGIEGDLVNDSVSVVITVNRSELGYQADKLADEVIAKLNSINWEEVAKYKAPAGEVKKRKRAKRRRRKSRRKRRSSRRSRK
jgi:hypothetical protein